MIVQLDYIFCVFRNNLKIFVIKNFETFWKRIIFVYLFLRFGYIICSLDFALTILHFTFGNLEHSYWSMFFRKLVQFFNIFTYGIFLIAILFLFLIGFSFVIFIHPNPQSECQYFLIK